MSDTPTSILDDPRRPAAIPPRWLVALAGLTCVAAFVVAASLFLPHQTLWNDESTQMWGFKLDPITQFRWLAGWRKIPNYVDDRMPPLSYWAGWAWSRAFGHAEATMRRLGLTAVALATLLVFLTGRRAWGLAAGFAAAMLFALSPGVVSTSVEIRAYPIYLLTSAATFYFLFRYLDAPDGRRLAGMTICAIAGVYTHFFGLVAAGGVFLAALILGPRRGGKVAPIIVAIAAVAAATVGIVPFVLASFGQADSSTGDALKAKLGLIAALAFRLVAHPSMLVHPVALVFCGIGAALSALAAFARKRRVAVNDPVAGSTAREPRDFSLALVVALVSGGVVISLARLAFSRFNAASGSYNLWIVPPLALLAGSGLAASSVLVRRVAFVGFVLLAGSFLAGDVQLARHGSFFAHGSHRVIDSWVRRLGPDRVAVVLDLTTSNAFDVFAPLRYEHANAVPQYHLDPGSAGAAPRVSPYDGALADPPRGIDPAALPYEYLIVVRAESQRSNQVVAQLRDSVQPLGDGPVALALKADPRWSLVGAETNIAYVAADVDVFRRNAAVPASTP